MKFYWKIALGIALVIALAGGFYFYFTKENKNANDINSGINGAVLLGPTCPVKHIPPDPRCADKPFKTTLAITTLDGTRVLKEFSSDADGKFKVNLSPGSYVVRSAAANILPRCASIGAITVRTGAYTSTTIYCDTGIR